MSKKTNVEAAPDAATDVQQTSAPSTIAKRGAAIAAENPLGLALGAAAVGFLAGLMVPITDYERQTVGPIRDDLVDRAQHVGSDAFEAGKQIIAETAQAALQTAQESAQRHAQHIVSEATAPMGDHMSNGNTTPTDNQGDTATSTGVSYGEILEDDDDAPVASASQPAAV